MQAETATSYAVVQTAGKQYMVRTNDTLKVDRMPEEVGKEVDLKPVLAISDGKALKIGTPVISDAMVKATVMAHVRGPKVVSFKQKRRKGYHRKIGHRQDLTVLKILSVG